MQVPTFFLLRAVQQYLYEMNWHWGLLMFHLVLCQRIMLIYPDARLYLQYLCRSWYSMVKYRTWLNSVPLNLWKFILKSHSVWNSIVLYSVNLKHLHLPAEESLLCSNSEIKHSPFSSTVSITLHVPLLNCRCSTVYTHYTRVLLWHPCWWSTRHLINAGHTFHATDPCFL